MKLHRLRIAVACGALALAGTACGSNGDGDKAVSDKPIATAAEVQAVVTSMTAQLQAAVAAAPGKPAPTSDEIKAQLTEQLRALGITL